MQCGLNIGGVPTNVTLRWYKAPAGAKFLPFPSAIFSHVWDNTNEADQDLVGEVGYPRTWDPGDNHGYQGQCYLGDPQWFQTGVLPPLASIAPPSGCLCQIPPEVGTGGLILGGSASLCSLAPSGVGCSLCPGGTQSVWLVSLSGGTGGYAKFNGDTRIVQGANCNWFNNCFGLSFILRYNFPPGPWQVTVNDGTNLATYWISGAFDCMAGGTFNLHSHSGTGTPAASLTVHT